MGGLTARVAENVKQMITQRVDRGRKAYGEFPEDQTRKGVFWGTKNPKKDGGYLVDETGNRRFWPIVVRGVIDDGTGKLKIDIEGAENRVLFDIESELENISHLFFEYHGQSRDEQLLGEMLQLVKRAGFRYVINGCHAPQYPFIQRINKGFDLQLNVSCYRP